MTEIEKLKFRIKNASRNSVEYKMSINEAKALIQEIEILENKSTKISEAITHIETEPVYKILDGGTF